MAGMSALARRTALLSPTSPRPANSAAWLGDSLTANGSTNGSNTGQYVGTLAADVAAGATSLSALYPYTAAAGYPNTNPPGTGAAYVIDPDTEIEEWFVPSAITGTGPYALTVPALTYGHKANAPIRNVARQWQAKSIPMWLSLISGNRVRFGGLYAHGGYTTPQIRSIYVPQIEKAVAAGHGPGVVFFCTGTNDNYDLVTALPLALDCIDRLTRIGVQVIVIGVPPSGGSPTASSTVNHVKWNVAMAHACARRGVQFVDVFAALVDDGSGVAGSGSYKTTWNTDNTHPSEIGAKVWAQAIWTAVQQFFPQYVDHVAPAINGLSDATFYPSNTNNGVLLTDTNADGIPDGWSKSGGQAGDTYALVTEAGVPGKMMSLTRAANGASDPILTSTSFVMIGGHKYRVYLRIKTSGVSAAYTAAATTTGTGGGSTTTSFQGFDVRLLTSTEQFDCLFSLKTWTQDIGLTTLTFDFVAPAGLTYSTCNFVFRLRGGATTPAYTVEIQPQLADLTSIGVS